MYGHRLVDILRVVPQRSFRVARTSPPLAVIGLMLAGCQIAPSLPADPFTPYDTMHSASGVDDAPFVERSAASHDVLAPVVLPDSQPITPLSPDEPAQRPGGDRTSPEPSGALPLAFSQNAATAQGNALSLQLQGSDPADGDLTFSLVSSPAHGSLGAIDNTPRFSARVTYTPVAGYSGSDAFTFLVRNQNNDASPVATVSIAVSPVTSLPPSISPASPAMIVAQNSASTSPANRLTLTAVDPDSPMGLIWSIASPAAHGTARVESGSPSTSGGPVVVSYQPASGYSGSDQFTIGVTDGDNTATATVSATVTSAAPTYALSGTVTRYAASGSTQAQSGVGLSFLGTGASFGTNFNVSTNSAGAFSQAVPAGWSGTLAATDANLWTLSPAVRTFSNVAAALGGQNFGAGRMYFVAPSGGNDSQSTGSIVAPFATINRAFQLVAPGDIVNLRAGQYNGVVGLAPTARGLAGAHIRLQSYNNEQVMVNSGQVGANVRFMYLTNANAYLDFSGMEFLNYRVVFDLDAGAAGVSHDLTFENIVAHECGTYQQPTLDGKAWRIAGGSYDVTLRNCDMYHCSGPGVLIRDNSHDILIEDCRSHDNSDGLGTGGDADGFTADWSGSVSDPRYPRNLTFRRCQTWNTAEDGIDCKGDNILYDACIMRDTGACCFKIWSMDGVAQSHTTIRNCLAYGSGEVVGKFTYTPDVALYNNTFVRTSSSNEATLIFKLDERNPNNAWRGSLLTANNVFIQDAASSSPVLQIYMDDWTIRLNHDVVHNKRTAANAISLYGSGRPGGVTTYSNTNVSSGTLFAQEGLEQFGTGLFPAFVNYAGRDLHLAPQDVVARNTGADLSSVGVLQDLEGRPRPSGPAFDRGCYESP